MMDLQAVNSAFVEYINEAWAGRKSSEIQEQDLHVDSDIFTTLAVLTARDAWLNNRNQCPDASRQELGEYVACDVFTYAFGLGGFAQGLYALGDEQTRQK